MLGSPRDYQAAIEMSSPIHRLWPVLCVGLVVVHLLRFINTEECSDAKSIINHRYAAIVSQSREILVLFQHRDEAVTTSWYF